MYFVFLTFVLVNQILISADNGFMPRGVALSRAALYDPQKGFSCLDGSKLIPFSFVNDDYCDCADGSDEPGTSACSQGQFYCLNVGHISGYIPTSRVNDNICDCCDGSDEQEGLNCPNNCEELGRAAREQAEQSARLAREGFTKRIDMSKIGKESRKSKEDERSVLQAELDAAEKIKQARQQMKEEAEKPEKEALEAIRAAEEEERKRKEEEEALLAEGDAESLFKLIDSNGDDKIDVQEMKARQTFDKNKDGIVDDEEARFFLNLEEEMSHEEFLKSGYYLVKPFFLLDKGMFTGPSPSSDEEGHEHDHDHEHDHENKEEQEQTQGEQKSDAGEEQQTHHDDDEEYDDEVEDQGGHEETSTEETKEPEEDPVQAGPPAPIESDKYDEATRALVQAADKARSEYEEAEKSHRDLTRKLQELNDALSLEFGEDERFGPLHGQCFDYEDREYVYTFCPYKEASQKGKSGGSVVNLGRWGSWTEKYSEMLLDHGQSCWNGPNRSARVRFQCGIENRLISVTEPSRCEYLFEFTTPATCVNPEGGSRGHDEL